METVKKTVVKPKIKFKTKAAIELQRAFAKIDATRNPNPRAFKIKLEDLVSEFRD